MKKYAIDIINRVHESWQQNAPAYKNGYAIFYGKVTANPPLMLIGLNPGGTQEGLDWKEDAIKVLDEEQEYIRFAQCGDYPLAQRTYALFDDIGEIDLLKRSVKTNLVFFRSRNWKSLPRKRESLEFCQDILVQVIRNLQPRLLLCESMAVLDYVAGLLYKDRPMINGKEHLRGNRRKYASYRCEESDLPGTLIGITHLTGSRPSTEDLDQIKELLKADLSS